MTIFKKPNLNYRLDKKREIPDGLWTKCPSCSNMLHHLLLEQKLHVCPECDHHFLINVYDRIKSIVNSNSFEEIFPDMIAIDPLDFKGVTTYKERLDNYRAKTGLNDAIVTGFGMLEKHAIGLAVMSFSFLAATMGSVVGEKITRLIEKCTAEKKPVIIVCASGGARMYEGMFSLMQMAKTSAALARHSSEKLPYISILTSPTTAGVMASFATLGDMIFAEPKSMIGFAGPRVIRETTHQDLPKGFQTAEFLCEKGLIDAIIHRTEIRSTLIRVLDHLL